MRKSIGWWPQSANGFMKNADIHRNITTYPPGKELVNGESVLYLGRQYRIELIETGLSEVQFAQRFLIPATETPQRTETLREWYIDKAKEKIVPRVKQHARSLGVKVSEIKIVDAATAGAPAHRKTTSILTGGGLKPPCLSSTMLSSTNWLIYSNPTTPRGFGILFTPRHQPWIRRRFG